jgi:hypothetical protein
MNDTVFDTTVVAFSNTHLSARRRGNSLDTRLRLLEGTIRGDFRVRYNAKLLNEYEQHVRQHRNDVIEMFFAVLDSERAVLVKKNSLSRQEFNLARNHRWPSHDQHLIAAALGGCQTHIYVTEAALVACASGIYRVFRIRVQAV